MTARVAEIETIIRPDGRSCPSSVSLSRRLRVQQKAEINQQTQNLAVSSARAGRKSEGKGPGEGKGGWPGLQNTNYLTANTRAGICARCRTRRSERGQRRRHYLAMRNEDEEESARLLTLGREDPRELLPDFLQKRRRFDVYENETVIVKGFTARYRGGSPPPPIPLGLSFFPFLHRPWRHPLSCY